ncbi:MAG: acyl-CoA synthetase (AMP-forming)/AMP-acid ligase II/acyl carrier protein [Bacteroidia bacterium]|jgi:acyl-CoA synthetase (AMP-forming)/AMP-acid ligase II/acyl carrier protein
MSKTIIDYLYQNAQFSPEALSFRFLNDNGIQPEEICNKGLWDASSNLAGFLKKIAEPGSRIMLFYPPGLEYVKAFYACLIAGMIAVPLYPPRKSSKSDRIVKVAENCRSEIALTNKQSLPTVENCWLQQNDLRLKLAFYATDCLPLSKGDTNCVKEKCTITPETPAFLQYTSGSTGSPKGVIITHGNVIANVKHLTCTAGGTQQDVFVNWLPLFHDLGLITAILWPVYLRSISVLMAPASFVRNPISWLEAISDYKGTMCGAPNFAYDLCYSKIKKADLCGIDLSSWKVAYNAAEPVKAHTLEKFSAYFSSYGFSEKTFYPGYGMAEATVFITGGTSTLKPKIIDVDRSQLAENFLKVVKKIDKSSTQLVSCGFAKFPHHVKIVDPQSKQELATGNVGEIWFCGPSVSPGYWQLEDESKNTFGQCIAGRSEQEDEYLRTGDLGAIYDDELYVTGRIKDLIILKGRNYYPQDIESTAASAHTAVKAGYVAAFINSTGHETSLTVVAELERSQFRKACTKEVTASIKQKVADDLQLTITHVVLLKPHSIPVTSSGKIQRLQTRIMLNDGLLEVLRQISDGPEIKVEIYKTEMELSVHKIWCRALKQKQIGIHANFFNIGGDSIVALEIGAALDRHFKSLSLDLDHLLDLPTIKGMADYIEMKKLHLETKPCCTSNQSERKRVRI